MARFNEKPWSFAALDEELYANCDELRRERGRTDQELEEFLAGIAPERLDTPFSYENYAGEKLTTCSDPRSFTCSTTKPIIADKLRACYINRASIRRHRCTCLLSRAASGKVRCWPRA